MTYSNGAYGSMASSRLATERGVALLLFILSLISLSLVVVALGSRQVMGQFMHFHLYQASLERHQEVEGLFARLAMEVNAIQGQAPLSESQLSGRVDPSDCPHPYKTHTVCWKVSVTDDRNQVVRERLLLVPESACAAPYWYAPAARLTLNSIDLPADEDFPYDPSPPIRPGLR